MRFCYLFFILLAILVVVLDAKKIEEEPRTRSKPTSYRSSLFPRRRELSDYEKCKMECRKLRDRVELEEYVQQLRDELSEVEARVQEDDKQREKEQPNLEEEGTLARMAKSAKRVASNVVNSVTGTEEDERPARTVVIHR